MSEELEKPSERYMLVGNKVTYHGRVKTNNVVDWNGIKIGTICRRIKYSDIGDSIYEIKVNKEFVDPEFDGPYDGDFKELVPFEKIVEIRHSNGQPILKSDTDKGWSKFARQSIIAGMEEDIAILTKTLQHLGEMINTLWEMERVTK